MEIYIILIAIPLILLAFFALGFYLVRTELRIRKNGIKTEATVVEIETLKSQQDVSYKLIVEFIDEKREKVRQAIDSTVSNYPKEKVPFTIPITYLETNQKKEIILSNNKTNLIIGFCISVFSVLMMILFVFYAIKNI